MSNYEPIRMRLIFSKLGDLRYVGHLDLQRLIERSLRRSALPMRYSQGFNPKVRLNLASALPLGHESVCEVMDFWLEIMVEPSEVKERLNHSLPSGIRILDTQLISSKLPSLQDALRESTFTVHFPNDIENAQERMEKVLLEEKILVTRRKKNLDIKPLILQVHWVRADQVEICLAARPMETGRVDELLNAANIDPAMVEIVRTGMSFEDSI